jgi:hypothetical protein
MEIIVEQSERTKNTYRLRCEKIVNESWSKVEEHVNEIMKALEKDILDERDILLLRLASGAFVQRVQLNQLESDELFQIDPNEGRRDKDLDLDVC